MTISALEYVKKQALGSVCDYLEECDVITSEVFTELRWWSPTKVVVDVEGVMIGFDGAETTGDDSPEDKGWEFDESTVKYVIEETKKVYVTTYPESDSPSPVSK